MHLTLDMSWWFRFSVRSPSTLCSTKSFHFMQYEVFPLYAVRSPSTLCSTKSFHFMQYLCTYSLPNLGIPLVKPPHSMKSGIPSTQLIKQKVARCCPCQIVHNLSMFFSRFIVILVKVPTCKWVCDHIDFMIENKSLFVVCIL